MLDTSTKRRIDSCRDILVGKVPDPKSQVEQITIALIYKFMDDMDAHAEEIGGKRTFFAGEFEKYAWRKLMAPSTGGQDMLNLYSEAIMRMGENPGIPALFRDIFKNAFLPYRDPETLRMFLKEIDFFDYDHSEKLGDAFEYLLSVLGSQGDAGQFRTPRHIIDFIVQVVDPKKGERILDPACGTAGFLISAYKHVLGANTKDRLGDTLTPDERTKLANNLKGYDISPDMVRLSLVNMYLHGFKDPHVYEYDTLTSQDRWNEMADVILANPPFMSPKGGIKPHNRFSVQSKRSEVLFVDYMAEHLTPGGRAGIIVPEGIIFQSQTAYKALRKMLVEQYLVAVVSLPAGVFNPYSGVKTSILILDKSLAKQSKSVGFFKVENDGFNLGAQRRPIDKNDLPQVLAEVNEYLRRLRAKESVAAEDFTPTRGLIVAKEKIAANGDYNLSGERYRDNGRRAGNWPMVRLGDVAEYVNGFAFKPEDWHGEGRPIIRIQNLTGTREDINRTKREDVPPTYLVQRGDLLISWSATIGFYIWQDEDAYLNQHIFRVDVKPPIDKMYLYFLGKRIIEEIEKDVHGNTMQHITKGRFEAIEIPLPPLEVQKEIVAEIEGYQRVIDGARAVLDHYRPHIPIQPDWPMVELGEVAEINPKKSEVDGLPGETVVSFVPMADLGEHSITFEPKDSKPLSEVGASYTYFRDNDVLIAKVTPCFENGKAGIARNLSNGIGFGSSEFFVIRCSEKLLPEWAFFSVANAAFRASATEKMTGTGGLQRVPRAVLEEHAIPLPPLETQRSIVSEIEAERRLVEANRELIARMETKIAAALARIWGEDSSSFVAEPDAVATNGGKTRGRHEHFAARRQ